MEHTWYNPALKQITGSGPNIVIDSKPGSFTNILILAILIIPNIVMIFPDTDLGMITIPLRLIIYILPIDRNSNQQLLSRSRVIIHEESYLRGGRKLTDST